MNITDIVNINLTRGTEVYETGTRPQVVLYGCSNAGITDGDIVYGYSSDFTKFYKKGSSTALTISSETLKSYLKVFFANGGSEVMLKTSSIPTTSNSLKTIDLTNVVLAQMNMTYTSAETIWNANKDLPTIYKKIICVASTTAVTKADYDGIAVKVSSVTGAEMAICAYLSKMKVYESGSPVDYAFTEEHKIEEDKLSSLDLGSLEIADLPYNFETKIGNRYLNIGGNVLSGNDLVEEYVSIVLAQTCTSAVFTALSTKVSGQVGLSVIRTALSAELDRYVSSGFLVTDKVWTKTDLYLPNEADTSLADECVVKKNTPISSGYLIHLFRLSKDGRKAYIYLILPTRKGIRYVAIDGELR